MEPTSINHIKKICKELGIRPARSKGQNFLISQNIVDEIIKAADLKKSELVIEVGAGFGTLTFSIAERVKRLIAVEWDKRIFAYLEKQTQAYRNIELVQADILAWLVGWPSVDTDYKVVANLPYQLTSRLLRLLLEKDNPPNQMVLMVQKEVGERIAAKPGKMSILSVMVQYYAQVAIIKKVNKINFWPQPKIDSLILKIERKQIAGSRRNEKEFFKLVRLGFAKKRRMLKNNLTAVYQADKAEEALKRIDLGLKVRAQELSVEDWARLLHKLQNGG